MLFLVQQVLFPLQWAVGEAITWRVDDAVRERVVAASFAPAGISTLEDEQTLNELGDIVNPLRGLGFSPGSACAGILALIPRYLQWAVAATARRSRVRVVGGSRRRPGALAVRIGVRAGVGRFGTFEAGFAPRRRRRDYYRDLLHSPQPAKEVRVFGLLRWTQVRYREHALDAVRPVWKARRRIVYLPYVLSLPFALVLSRLASVGVARAAARGELSLGEMALALQAIVLTANLAELFFEADRQTEFGLQSFGAVERFERLADAAGGERRRR